jgi:hypothetical protein
MMLMDWAITQMRSFNLLSIHSVVMPFLSCHIPMVTAAHWQTPTLAFSAQVRTSRVSISIVLVSVMTDFRNQKASDNIVGYQQWPLITWLMSNAYFSKQASRLFNTSSRVIRCGNRGEEGVFKVLEILSTMGRQGKYKNGPGGFS